MAKIYRDDDVNKYTDIGLMEEIHAPFIKYNKIHTIAVEMEDLWESKHVWYWITETPNIDVELHGWTHKDYSAMSYEDVRKDIQKSLDYWNGHTLMGGYKEKQIKVFYPPWNRVSPILQDVCDNLGLKLDNRVGGDVYNFHWWTFRDKRREDLKKLQNDLCGGCMFLRKA